MDSRETAKGSLSSQTERLAQFDHAIAYILALWPALTLAVNEQWGAESDSAVSSSDEKRALFAGAISDIFTERPQTDEQDLEEVLLQVMEDEFCTVVEDASEQTVAAAILRARQECLAGNFEGVIRLEGQWRAARGAKVTSVKAGSDEQDDEEDDSEDEDEDDNGDVKMGEDDEVPQLVETRNRIELEVDEDGFTKVVNRRRR